MPKLENPMESGLNKMTLRVKALGELLNRLEQVPEEWIAEAITANVRENIQPASCTSYKQLITAWRKALLWTPGLDHALAVMLASIISTKGVGDQLWIKVIGPPSCGKSTLCEAVSVAKQYVYAKSTIRGFFSGFKSKDGKDNSLIPKIRDKTLVTKDGDTLLQSPNLSQILSEARDIYDRVGRTHYRQGIETDYSNINMTWILAGTSSLKLIDASELGERFLDIVIMEGIDDELENEILMRVAYKTNRNRAIESNGQPDTRNDEELTNAMKLTGGYVIYLRENAVKMQLAVTIDDRELKECIILGKFVAFMRARPSKTQKETVERELGARLVSQHIRLTGCLAAVMNRTTADKEVMRRVTEVALHTCRGQTLEIIKEIYNSERRAATARAIALATGFSDGQTRAMLRFLSRIEVVEKIAFMEEGVRSKPYWRLTSKLRKLYEQVVLKGAK